MIHEGFFLIKPDGFPYKASIHKLFRTVNLQIFSEKDFCLDERIAKELFPYTQKMENYDALIEYLCEGKTNAGIVTGDDVIPTLAKICGTFTEPEKNPLGTIRKLFGKGYTKTASGLYVVRNAIHRSKSEEQTRREMEWYQRKQ